MASHVLLCDFTIGASIKLALTEQGRRPDEPALYNCSDTPDFNAAVLDFLAAQGKPPLMAMAISARGWERKGVLVLPEKGMTIIRNDVRQLLDIQRINMVNNFVARALAIPWLEPDEVEKICGGDAMDEQVIAVLGPHHGLGLAGLAPDGAGGWTAMPSEGGHSDLPANSDRQLAVLKVLRDKHGHVAREFVMSLSGLVELWQALNLIEHGEAGATLPEEVIARASIGDPLAVEAVQLCVGWLGAMAGDVALTMGARGGIYLTGDLMDMLGDLFDKALFAHHYADKGRLSDYVAEIPVYKTLAKDLEIIGLSTLFY